MCRAWPGSPESPRTPGYGTWAVDPVAVGANPVLQVAPGAKPPTTPLQDTYGSTIPGPPHIHSTLTHLEDKQLLSLSTLVAEARPISISG